MHVSCHEKLPELDTLLLNDCLHLVILNEYRFWELGESGRAKLRNQSIVKASRYVNQCNDVKLL